MDEAAFYLPPSEVRGAWLLLDTVATPAPPMERQ